ncbi:molybdopterin-dependent oxidoreductase [Aliivibrio kagoshimensis]|uniref:molybdopterin-dependent oxidoreductase n=1 Tax=Aliivibrio kagoshimensis TaxID=2910230 RepID=UPI003D0BBB1D
MKWTIFFGWMLFSVNIHASSLVIERVNNDETSLSFTELTSLPSASITTDLPWTPDVNTYTGVPLIELLRSEGIEDAKAVILYGLNDYAAVVQMSDVKKYNPIIAYYKNSKPMKVRDKGPYWLIFPLDQYEELNTAYYYTQMVWQLEKVATISND